MASEKLSTKLSEPQSSFQRSEVTSSWLLRQIKLRCSLKFYLRCTETMRVTSS